MTHILLAPRYRSHKEVQALKIHSVEVMPDGSALLEIADEGSSGSGFAPVAVDKSMIARYMPHHGDYLVIYADGYRAISPAKAFEEGYTPIS